MWSPKLRLTLHGLHGVIAQKTELLVANALRSLYPTRSPTVVKFIQTDSQNIIPCALTHLNVLSREKINQTGLWIVSLSLFPLAPT
jgi:hypothetical protein